MKIAPKLQTFCLDKVREITITLFLIYLHANLMGNKLFVLGLLYRGGSLNQIISLTGKQKCL